MNSTELQSAIARHLRMLDASILAGAGAIFAKRGCVTVPFLVPADVKNAVAGEVLRLVDEESVRRDLIFQQTGNTPRRMRNVTRSAIRKRGELLPAAYESSELKHALARIAGEPVFDCPYEPEQYLITSLERSGDTHGWHWDDFSFALVWVIDCPPLEHGGFVQCVPETTWDKANPSIYRAMASSVTYTMELHPGDLYLMRTDTTLHRVYPISAGRRVIVNMGYAAQRDFAKQISHETMDDLWSTDTADGAEEVVRHTAPAGMLAS